MCVHGHFYQPPREDPWLEAVAEQDSAYPFHDWNERVTSECYGPNAWSRVLDQDSKVARAINNYARMSFNFGPTLLSWLEENDAHTYRAILEADRMGQRRFGGHGPAIAQCYNHIIMPLANSRDRRTQVVWGIEDFRRRFGRRPEGMWLPETAVDLETLGLLASHGIKFTVLAPRQAARVRPLAGGGWQDVPNERVDTTRPYLVRLTGGQSIAVFFYDGATSRAVAFEGLLHSGQTFAARLTRDIATGDVPGLAHIATDGESYGHHHRFGDMALAKAMDEIEGRGNARVTVYGEYLERNPPQWEAQVKEGTSWSCEHGVERWRSACGCNAGRNPAWRQHWRGPLREALDWLRDKLASLYEAEAEKLLRDPWAARDAYITVVLDRSPSNTSAYFAAHAKKVLSAGETVRALRLLEMQRHALLMYASCGWYFDDISGIEAVQVLQYAGRALHLAREFPGASLEGDFMRLLSVAKSNIPEYGDGAGVFRRLVKPSERGVEEVGAHYALRALFEDPGPHTELHAFDVRTLDWAAHISGSAKFARGRAKITSHTTLDEATLDYAALHVPGKLPVAWVREPVAETAQEVVGKSDIATFESGDYEGLRRALDSQFGGRRVPLEATFLDTRRHILRKLLTGPGGEALRLYAAIYEQEAPGMRLLAANRTDIPPYLREAASYVLDIRLRQAINAPGGLDADAVRACLGEAESFGAPLDPEGLGYLFSKRLRQILLELAEDPYSLDNLNRLATAAGLALAGPWRLDLSQHQAMYFELMETHYVPALRAADSGDASRKEWAARAAGLAEMLAVRLG